ncbi:MAG TPA: CocE/NonD family hydrolase [Stenotrophobium sp.]|nr:CocE/NonD family hydrolase [Stenotrophobium sp.]
MKATITATTCIIALLCTACGMQGSTPVAASASGKEAAFTLPPTTYSKTVSQEVSIPMDDGVLLGATVTFPSLDGKTPAPGKFPVVLSMTPYGRHALSSAPDQPTFATRGMIGAVVDVRGTGGSEGNLDGNYFSPREARDGYELIEYFGTQPYSSGKVGMSGGSYVGITQLLAAEQQPPHLAAIAPQVALSDLYRDGYTHGGILNLFFDVQYIAVQGAPGYAGVNTDPGMLQQTVLGKLQQLTGTPILFDYLQRPNDDVFYRDRSPIYNIDRIQVPVLIVDGWRDGFVRGAIENYKALAQRPGVETRLYIDPCTHKGCGGEFAPLTNPPNQDNEQAVIVEFLSHYLLGTPIPPRSPVRVYLQPGNGYLESRQWPPPQTQMLKMFLDSGMLTATAPTAGGSESYFTNPAAGLSMSFDEYGTVAASPYLPTDQRLADGMGLTWRSAPLTQKTTLVGPTILHLVAASTASDTDWIAKLADVGTDGSETLISNGYLRASHRALDTARSQRNGVPYHTHVDPMPLTSGQTYDFDFEIWPTAYVLAAGHRLQLRLTSYDVPTHAPVSIMFDRNNPLATQIVPLLPATNTVMEGGADPSSLTVPVYGG